MYYVKIFTTEPLSDSEYIVDFQTCSSLEDAERLEAELVAKHTDDENLFASSLNSEIKPYETSKYGYIDFVSEKNALANDVPLEHSQEMTIKMANYIASHIGQSRGDLLSQFVNQRTVTGILLMALGDAERYGVGLTLPVSEAHDRIIDEFRALDEATGEIDDNATGRFVDLILRLLSSDQ